MDLVSEIKARADIVQIISAHVPLKKAGKDFKARCPFHSEKTPSFTVSAEKQLFYCFGCGVGGDLIRFVTLIEKIDAREAIRRLADRLGIERPQASQRAHPVEPVRKALELAARFFEAALQAPVGASARAYLAGRKMPENLEKEFRIGCAPDRTDALTRRLMDRGVAKKILIEAGLSAPVSEGSSNLRDRFRGRLMFPILDGGGHVVGFGGRVIKEGDRRPKYLNSAENELFHKGKLLYGYHTAKNTASRDAPPVLVEGYLDVIYAQSAGLSAMAALGTALTDTQSELLARFRLPVLLAYDTDEAGRRAAIRALKILWAKDVEAGILVFGNGKDPAEMVERGETEQLLESVSKPLDAFEFLVNTALDLFPHNVAGRRQASEMVCDAGSGLKNEILRQELIRAYANGFDLVPADAAGMLKIHAESAVRVPALAEDVKQRTTSLLLAEGVRREWAIIGAAMAREDLMALAYAQIEDWDFEDPDGRMVWDAMAVQYERRHTVDFDELVSAFADHPGVIDRLTQVRLNPPVESKLDRRGFADLLSRQRIDRLKRQSANLRSRLQAEAGKDREQIKRLQEEDRRIQRQMRAMTPGQQ